MRAPIACWIAGCGFCFGQHDSTAPASKLGFSSSGYVYWENFRLWEADYGGNIHKGDWFNSILGGFVLENAMSERLRTRVALEARFYRPFPEEDGQDVSRFTNSTAYVHEAKAIYAFGNLQSPAVEMEVGYFLYDYNKDQHNLGEYLFRSKIYPINLFTDFELPMDRLLGIRLGQKPFKGFHHDLLLTSEYKYYPKSDFSLSYLADYQVGGVFTVGAGVSLAHYFPVRPSAATPKSESNSYLVIEPQTFQDSAGNTHVIPGRMEGFPSILVQDTSISYLDSFTAARFFYPQIRQKTTYYTFKGVKLMGRVAVDPKPLFGSPSFLGAEDLKIYSEVTVLGVEDYPFYYNQLSQRIPVMFGFNFPAFKILDVIGLEAEYCGYKFPDDWEKSLRYGLPQPGSANFAASGWIASDYAQDDWKWSVYLRKQVSRGLFLSAQMANDHLRMADKAGHTYESLMKNTDNPFSGQWWGILRVTASY